MTWQVFIEDNDRTFRREYGIRNDEGEREVLAWIMDEAMTDAAMASKEMGDWVFRAGMLCAEEATARNRR